MEVHHNFQSVVSTQGIFLCNSIWSAWWTSSYSQTYNIRGTDSPKLKCFTSRHAVVFAHSIEARCQVENADSVGAAPTGYPPTTSEWSILLPTKMRLILEVWWYMKHNGIWYTISNYLAMIKIRFNWDTHEDVIHLFHVTSMQNELHTTAI